VQVALQACDGYKNYAQSKYSQLKTPGPIKDEILNVFVAKDVARSQQLPTAEAADAFALRCGTDDGHQGQGR